MTVFGLCHGYAHGAELPLAASPLFYSMGFMLSTVFFHVIGIFIGELASSSLWHSRMLRSLGAAMTLAGIWFVSR